MADHDPRTARRRMIENVVQRVTDYYVDLGLMRTCCNCAHWKPDVEICGFWNGRPPAPVIVTGCDDHSDYIPF